MADRVVLHVGLPKTGTTYLQQLLWANRDRLRAADVHLVVGTMRELYDAARDLGHGGRGDWRRLVEAVHACSGTVVLSCEGLSAVAADRAEAALTDLRPADVLVVCTLRDPARVLPSVWQQQVRTGSTVELAEFVAHVRNGMVWEWLPDPLAVLDAWSWRLPAKRVRLVTVPGASADPNLLWERFATACGLDPHLADQLPAITNPSLPAVQVELLRRVNVALGDRRPAVEARYRELVRPLQGRRAVARASRGEPTTLRLEDQAWAAATARDLVDALELRGHPVVGDLAELRPAEPGRSELSPADAATAGGLQPDDAEVASVAVELTADLLVALRHARRVARAHGER